MLEKQNLKEKIIKLYNMSLILDMAGMAFFILCILFQEKLYMFATEELIFTVPWPEVVSNTALLASHGVFVLIIKKQLKRGKKDIVVEITGLNWIFLVSMMISLFFMFVEPYLYRSADFSATMSIIAMQTYYNVFTTVMHISQALFFVACGLSISYKAIERMLAIKTVYLVAFALGVMDWSMSMYLVISFANILAGAQSATILAELTHVRAMVGRYSAAGKMSAALMLIGFGLSMGYGKMRSMNQDGELCEM